MTDDGDLEHRLKRLEGNLGFRDRHGMPAGGTPPPIEAPKLSHNAIAKAEHDAMRRRQEDEFRAAEAERIQREREEAARPRTLAELRTELKEIDEELRTIASRPTSPTSGASWQARNDHRIAVQAAAARADQLRGRRDEVTNTIEVIVGWRRNERARRRAAAELPKARKVLADITAELRLVEGECTQARAEVQRLESILIRPDVVPEEP